MSQLSEYLASNGISQASFAKSVKISRSYLSEIVNGAKSPGLETAQRISSATDGQVTISAWPQFKNLTLTAHEGEGREAS